ncbi:MAG: FecR family protein [Spirochaetaceae bacterium]|jgi:hypothetical protein|nr:FecR family protein [Spirochaetaceae bacterium]
MRKNSTAESRAGDSRCGALGLFTALVLFFLVPLFWQPGFADAQESGFIQIIDAGGSDFIVLSQGRRVVYSPESLREEAVYLGSGDMLQTGPGSFAELQLSGGARLKLAENSSLRFGEGGAETPLRFFYGRLRLRTGPGQRLAILTDSRSVEFDSGDGAVDYILRPGSALPVFAVSMFEGTAHVRAGRQSPLHELAAFEKVGLEETTSYAWVERGIVDDETLAYWNAHNFKDAPPLVRPGLAVTVPEQPKEIPFTLPDTSVFRRPNRMKNVMITTGVVFSLAGLGLNGAGFWHLDREDYDMARIFMISGAAVSGFGILTLLGALAINPPSDAALNAAPALP